MKKIFLLVLTVLFTVTLGLSQTSTKIYNFKDIKGIDASSIYKIYITNGNSNTVKVTYPNEIKEYININNYNSILKCQLNLPKNYNYKRNNNNHEIIVELEMKTINLINLSGAANIFTTGNFTTNDIKIDISGASKINNLYIQGKSIVLECSGASFINQKGNFEKCYLDISGATKITLNGDIQTVSGEISGASLFNLTSNSSKIELDVSGASKSNLYGSCQEATFECSGASYINAKELKCTDAIIEASGASKVNIFVENNFKADASTASVINYYGNPKHIITKPTNIRKAD